MARSTKQGDRLSGAIVVIVGSRKEQSEARKPRTWLGITLGGSSKDVAALTLSLDIGHISDIDTDMKERKKFIEKLLYSLV
ncbi:MAG: hypothetical protein P4L49_19565 [Desulfosporosinus sp.]|nr:hypothetical protein [Desulfosporosinus sp.]